MAFKRRGPEQAVATDPEQLYRSLAGRNGAPEALWVHQGDVLRSWHTSHLKDRDVAIELPTGAGKTLVGGLIAEWRRQSYGERVSYLCPTRQLAQQTAAKLSSYGIPNVLLTGQVSKWNSADRAMYSSSKATAVSVYNHIFNTNPGLDTSGLLLLDDAHAAEGAVAGLWRISIERDRSTYQDVLSVLADAFDPLVLKRLRTDRPEGQFLGTTYLASPLGVHANASALEEVLAAAASANGLERAATYALTTLSGHLDRCLVYASYRSILIRPLIPPTWTHPSFENAQQRVYMSATLGEGGELERAFGRLNIKRIATPKGWEKQGTGRRLFCFPQLTTDLAGDRQSADKWVKDFLNLQRKAVVMTPDGRAAKNFREKRLPSDLSQFTANDVEDDLDRFGSAPEGILLVTNRYDGIDLPDDTCRTVVIDSLPAKGDLQERFLYSDLQAVEVLQERIRARISQGAGRATRNSRDYATVILLSEDLTSFIGRQDVLSALHPELQSEISFGLENSLYIDSSEMLDNIRTFLKQDHDWRDVENDITSHRDTLTRQSPPGTLELQKSARFEVEAWQSVWQSDWSGALTSARKVLDSLIGGQAPQRYAALWNYLAACWSCQLASSSTGTSLREASVSYYLAARKAGRGTTWLSHVASPSDQAFDVPRSGLDPIDQAAAKQIAATIATLGRPAAFNTQVSKAEEALGSTEAKAYEAGLVYMGWLAGANPSEGDGNATALPDATWVFSSAVWICWEAKSEAKPDGELGADRVRQAGGHLRTTADRYNLPIPGGSIALLMTPQLRTHPQAYAVAEEHVYVVRPAEVSDVFARLVRAWRTLRSRGIDEVDESQIVEILRDEKALPSQWLNDLTNSPLRANLSEEN